MFNTCGDMIFGAPGTRACVPYCPHKPLHGCFWTRIATKVCFSLLPMVPCKTGTNWNKLEQIGTRDNILIKLKLSRENVSLQYRSLMYHLLVFGFGYRTDQPRSDTVQVQMVCGSLVTRKFCNDYHRSTVPPMCFCCVNIENTSCPKASTSFLGARSPSTQHVLHY
jgi:hypothetical protein